MNKKIFYGWYIVVAGILMNAIGSGLMSILAVFLPAISKANGYSQTQVSSIIAFITVGSIIGGMFLGKMVQNSSKRKIVLIFGAMEAVLIACMGIVHLLPALYALSLMVGIATVMANAMTMPTLITTWFEEKRGLAMGIMMSGIGLGSAVIVPILSPIIASKGYETGFFWLSIIIAIFVAISYLLIRDTPKSINLKPYGQNPGDKKVKHKDTQVSEVPEPSRVHDLTLKEASHTGAFWFLIGFCFFSTLVSTGIIVQMASYMTYLEFDAGKITTIIGVFGIFSIIGKILVGIAYDKLGLTKSNVIFGALMIITILAIISMPSIPASVYIYMVCAGAGLVFSTIAYPLFISAFFGSKNYGEIYPITIVVLSLSSIIASILSGFVIDKYGYSMLFNIELIFGILTVLTAQLGVSSAQKIQRKYQNTENTVENVKMK